MSKQFVASFFTMLGAIEFHEKLQDLGDQTAKMAPVPRKVSISCGTGVFFTMPFDEAKMNNPDLDSVFIYENDDYTKLWSQDD